MSRKDEIQTREDSPPIPDRRFDWSAWRGDYDLGTHVSYGATKEEAIKELLEWEEMQGDDA